MKCTAHLLGLDWECRTPRECNHGSSGIDDPGNADSSPSPGGDVSSEDLRDSSDNLGSSEGDDDFVELRTYKDDSALKDQQSTGRKRAAKAYPLDETALCEWSMKKNCGGGKFPIVGCVSGLQQARHHGPDKNTLNNERGNVHRICHTCHNRWHTLNDEGYIWGSVYDLHDPRTAEIIDMAENEEFWEGRRIVKAKD